MLRIPRNFCWFCILFVVSTRLTEVHLLIYSFSLYILFSLLSEFWKIWYCNVGIVVSNSSKRSLQAIFSLVFLVTAVSTLDTFEYTYVPCCALLFLRSSRWISRSERNEFYVNLDIFLWYLSITDFFWKNIFTVLQHY